MRFAFDSRVLVPVSVAALCLGLLGDNRRQDLPTRRAFASAMPQTVVWAWEEPEDLRLADPASVGVAYLAETLLLGGSPRSIVIARRHQPLAVAPGASVMAVVRIETLGSFRDTPEVRARTVDLLAEVAHQPSIRVFQIDFDATRSQQAFYAGVLTQLRPRLPTAMPLSITALASWCAARPEQSWLADLPIDEAVPMFFRLGGTARPYADKSWLQIREPLCRGSIGLSVDESWPDIDLDSRVYLFAPRPWLPTQLAALENVANGDRAAVLRVPNRSALDQGSVSRLTRPLPASEVLDGPVLTEDAR